MKIVVLGGLGIQGRTALKDLSGSKIVDEVICADSNLDLWPDISRQVDEKKIQPVKINVEKSEELKRLLSQDVDVAIDLLPLPLMRNALESAIEVGVPMISTNYGSEVRHLHNATTGHRYCSARLKACMVSAYQSLTSTGASTITGNPPLLPHCRN